MKQETIKIQLLNDTTLCVRPVLPDMKTTIDPSYLINLSVKWGLHGHETEEVTGVTTKDGYILIPISHTMPLGVYDVHIQAFMEDEDQVRREVSDNRKAMFELVKYGNGISYENYYTDMVIIGLPDSYVEQLRREWEQKIAEAEAAKQEAIEKAEEYEQKVLEIDDLARKGDIPTDYARAGEHAKTLDDIKVDIPDDLARKGDIASLEEVVSKKIGPMDQSGIKGVGIDVNDDYYAGTGNVVKVGRTNYYEWENAKDAEDKIYTRYLVFAAGDDYYERVDESTMSVAGTIRVVYTESLVSMMINQSAKLDKIVAAVSLTASDADEDWQNVQPA